MPKCNKFITMSAENPDCKTIVRCQRGLMAQSAKLLFVDSNPTRTSSTSSK